MLTDKYIIVTTLCDKENVKESIIDTMLRKHLVAGTQVSNVHSKHYWNGKIEEKDEYKIEFRTLKKNYDKIEKEILKISDYLLPEISYVEIKGSKDFLSWINDETGIHEKTC